MWFTNLLILTKAAEPYIHEKQTAEKKQTIKLFPKTKSWTVFDLTNTCLIISFTHLNFSSERRQSSAQHKLFLSFVINCRTKMPVYSSNLLSVWGHELGSFKHQPYCTSEQTQPCMLMSSHVPSHFWEWLLSCGLDVLVTFGLELSNIIVSPIYLIVKLSCCEIMIPLPRRKDAETSWNVGYVNIEEQKRNL